MSRSIVSENGIFGIRNLMAWRVSSHESRIYVVFHIFPSAINIFDKYLMLKQKEKSFSGTIYEMKSFSGFPAFECNNG